MEKNKDESSYQKVRKENEELHKQFDWLTEEAFVLSDKADIRQIYYYLKQNPKSAKFIYKKYKDHQITIEEFCDPENPLYLEDVMNELSETIKFKNDNRSLEELQTEYGNVQRDFESLKNERKELEKKYDQIVTNLEEKKKQLDDLDRLSGNIRSDPGLEKIGTYITDAKAILETINNKGMNYFIGHPTDTVIQITITRDQKQHISALIKNADELKKYLESNDFLSTEYLDEFKKKIKSDMDNEKENAKNEVEYVKALNPLKSINRITDGLTIVRKKLDSSEEIGGIVTFARTGLGVIKATFDEFMGLLDNMRMQFSNIKDRERKSLFN